MQVELKLFQVSRWALQGSYLIICDKEMVCKQSFDFISMRTGLSTVEENLPCTFLLPNEFVYIKQYHHILIYVIIATLILGLESTQEVWAENPGGSSSVLWTHLKSSKANRSA
jgi:hypothetical protein